MVILVRIIGIIIGCLGIVFLISPQTIKGMISFWSQGKRLYLGGALRILFGLIFLLAVPQCRLAWVIFVIGILALIKALLIFILGLEKMKSLLNWWNNRPPVVLRLMGFIVLAFGVLLLYSA